MKKPFIIRYRIPIIILFLLLPLLNGLGILTVEAEPDINAMISESMSSRRNIHKIEAIFGSSDYVFLVLETDDVLNSGTLRRVRDLTRHFEKQVEFTDVSSLFTMKHIRNSYGMMNVEDAVPFIPDHPEAREKLRSDIRENRLVYGVAVSKDFRMTAILLTPVDTLDQNFLADMIESAVEKYPGPETIHTGGLPIIKAAIVSDIFKDLTILLPLGFLLMIIMLLTSFRQIRGVILPFGVVFLSILLAFGLMGILSWKIAIVSILMPVMLIAVANDYGIHMISRYQELLRESSIQSAEKISDRVMQSLKKPIMVTGLTTIAGILGLLFHIIVHARQVGVLAAVGIGWAVLMSVLFIPAVLSFLPKRVPIKKTTGKSRFLLDRILTSAAGMIIQHPRRVIILFLLITAGLLTGVSRLHIDGNLVNFFKKGHPVKVSDQLINDNFGGSQSVSVVFKGNMTNPELLARMEKYEEEILANDYVGDIMSPVSVLKEISKGLFDPDEKKWNCLPESENGAAQYLELYYMSGDPDDFEELLDMNYEYGRMLIRINNSDSYILNGIIDEIRNMTESDPALYLIGGHALVTYDISHAIVSGQSRSLLIAALAVVFMMMIFLRSVRGGLFALLPLLCAEAVLFGLMGYFAIPLDVATVLLSSVMIGVGIDYTIHFIWRYRDERSLGKTATESVRKTITGSGRGIFFNALSVMVGFSVLFFSSFKPIQHFGFLVVISIVSCLAGALLLVPALCIAFKPKWLEKSTKGLL